MSLLWDGDGGSGFEHGLQALGETSVFSVGFTAPTRLHTAYVSVEGYIYIILLIIIYNIYL